MTEVIRAAGGVVWRRSGPGEVDVALIHRPRYDDWSLPKGKIDPGEHPVLAAVREAGEETGESVRVGPGLATVTYALPEGTRPPGDDRHDLAAAARKTVQLFSLEARGGTFRAGLEVDQLRWLPVSRAAAVLTHPHDAAVVSRFRPLAATTPILVVRHASAGARGRWPGPDAARPLDGRGEKQAAVIANLAAAYGVQRLLSAPPRRCVETVTPAAHRLRLGLDIAAALGEEDGDPQAAADLARADLSAGAVLLCSQGGLLEEVLAVLTGRPARDLSTPKGGVWVAHLLPLTGDVVALDRLGDAGRPDLEFGWAARAEGAT